jgi:hypothetical protein
MTIGGVIVLLLYIDWRIEVLTEREPWTSKVWNALFLPVNQAAVTVGPVSTTTQCPSVKDHGQAKY